MADQGRNDLILDDLIASLEEGRSPMLLTERRDHVEFFAEQPSEVARNVVVLTGGGGPRARRKAAEELAEIPDSEERVVLATGRFIGEGFDDPRLDTLFLALPIAWKGTLVQYAGRLHRRHQGKTEVRIYDYVDEAVPMLARMFDETPERLPGDGLRGGSLGLVTGGRREESTSSSTRMKDRPSMTRNPPEDQGRHRSEPGRQKRQAEKADPTSRSPRVAGRLTRGQLEALLDEALVDCYNESEETVGAVHHDRGQRGLSLRHQGPRRRRGSGEAGPQRCR